MIRRALIVHCGNTSSGKLSGPSYDNRNLISYLKSRLGGMWQDEEIRSLQNPTSITVLRAVNNFLSGAHYTFVVFTGHGFIDAVSNKQYIELSDESIPMSSLKTNATRQTIIIDACRGFYSELSELTKSFSKQYESYIGDPIGTREIFDRAVLRAEEGLTIMYAASRNQSALDTIYGAAYLISLIKVAENWGEYDKSYNILTLKSAHGLAKQYLSENFDTIQVPTMNIEKRLTHFPFAVKITSLNG